MDLIDPFIGAVTTSADTACGKTYPDAVKPFGMLQLSPDTVSDAAWFRGRNADGSWMGPADGCIESNPEQQGWFVPHDVQGLIGLAGGRQAFTDRLNRIFERTPPELMMKWNEDYNHSNEHVQQMPSMFTYVCGRAVAHAEMVALRLPVRLPPGPERPGRQ